MTKAAVPIIDLPATPYTSGAAMDVVLESSFAHCHEVARQRAKNFYYGLRLTPGAKRLAGYAIYAFMRACDDLVDQPLDEAVGRLSAHATAPALPHGASDARDATVRVGLERIEEFRRTVTTVLTMPVEAWAALPRPSLPGGAALAAPALEPAATDPAAPFWPAFRHAVRAYHLDPRVLHGMLDGQAADLIKHRYDHFDQLYDYCYKVASVVGIVCISLWGAGHSPEARKLAEYRGVALQLTNILRDIAEDAGRGRVYLPADELAQFGLTQDQLIDSAANGDAPAGFEQLMRFQIERARGYYEMSLGLERHLDRDCRATCWALMAIYRALLERIAASPTRVLRHRVRLSNAHKCWIGAQAMLRQRMGR